MVYRRIAADSSCVRPSAGFSEFFFATQICAGRRETILRSGSQASSKDKSGS